MDVKETRRSIAESYVSLANGIRSIAYYHFNPGSFDTFDSDQKNVYAKTHTSHLTNEQINLPGVSTIKQILLREEKFSPQACPVRMVTATPTVRVDNPDAKLVKPNKLDALSSLEKPNQYSHTQAGKKIQVSGKQRSIPAASLKSLRSTLRYRSMLLNNTQNSTGARDSRDSSDSSTSEDEDEDDNVIKTLIKENGMMQSSETQQVTAVAQEDNHASDEEATEVEKPLLLEVSIRPSERRALNRVRDGARKQITNEEERIIVRESMVLSLMGFANYSSDTLLHISDDFRQEAAKAEGVIVPRAFTSILNQYWKKISKKASIQIADEQIMKDIDGIAVSVSESGSLIDRLFDIYDDDDSHSLDMAEIREFVVGLSGFIQSSHQEKLDTIFALYSSEDDPDHIFILDFIHVVMTSYTKVKQVAHYINVYYRLLHRHVENRISENDFIRSCLHEPLTLNLLNHACQLHNLMLLCNSSGRVLMSTASVCEKSRTILQTFRDRTNLSWLTLIEMQQVFVKHWKHYNPMDAAESSDDEEDEDAMGIEELPTEWDFGYDCSVNNSEFADLMVSFLKDPVLEDIDMLSDLFDAYKCPSKNELSWRTLLWDLSMLLPNALVDNSSAQARAAFYFRHYDRNHDTILTLAELFSATSFRAYHSEADNPFRDIGSKLRNILSAAVSTRNLDVQNAKPPDTPRSSDSLVRRISKRKSSSKFSFDNIGITKQQLLRAAHNSQTLLMAIHMCI